MQAAVPDPLEPAQETARAPSNSARHTPYPRRSQGAGFPGSISPSPREQEASGPQGWTKPGHCDTTGRPRRGCQPGSGAPLTQAAQKSDSASSTLAVPPLPSPRAGPGPSRGGGARPSKARQAANAAADDGEGKEPVKAICATGRKKGKLSSREEEEASFFRGQLQLW